MGTPIRSAKSPCVIFFGARNSSRSTPPGEAGRRFFGIMSDSLLFFCRSLQFFVWSLRSSVGRFASSQEDAAGKRIAGVWHGDGPVLSFPSRRHEALRPRFYPTGGLATKG